MNVLLWIAIVLLVVIGLNDFGSVDYNGTPALAGAVISAVLMVKLK